MKVSSAATVCTFCVVLSFFIPTSPCSCSWPLFSQLLTCEHVEPRAAKPNKPFITEFQIFYIVYFLYVYLYFLMIDCIHLCCMVDTSGIQVREEFCHSSKTVFFFFFFQLSFTELRELSGFRTVLCWNIPLLSGSRRLGIIMSASIFIQHP